MSNKKVDAEETPAPESESLLNPRIGQHSTYVGETKRLLELYVDSESYEELEHQVLDRNILNKDTEQYRRHILQEIARRYIPDKDEFSQTPLMEVVTADVREDVIDWCIYYEFAQDPFLHKVIVAYLYPEYQRGKLSIDTGDVVNYLESIEDTYPELQERSDITIRKAAAKVLTSLKNFGLLEGRNRKEFAMPYIPDKAIAYVVYRLSQEDVTSASEVIGHEDWKLFFMSEDDVRRRIRDISPDYVTYEKRGSTERLNKKYESMEALIDAF